MKSVILHATTRSESGKGAARKARMRGLVPAIFYGYETEPIAIEVDSSELIKILKQGQSGNLFIKLGIESDAGEKIEKLSVIKDIQIDTLRKKPLHADFYEIGMSRKLTMDLPLILQGIPIGVEQGGELQQMKRDIRITGLPAALPEMVEIDISHLEIGDSIKVGDITLAEGIEILDAEDIAIANVVVTRVSELHEETGEEATEEAEEAAGQPDDDN